MKSRTRPLIGITMRHEVETERFYLARFYSEAIEAAGGVPLHIPLIPRAEYVAQVSDELDGVLLPGSASDVDPLRYGREPHMKLGSVHELRDETDLLILSEVERRGMPLLAICFGMQMLNVWRGGILIQDIESQVPDAIKHEQGSPRGRRSHRVKLLPDSLVAGLAGDETALVNSHHHQAIEMVGAELRATAWTADGLVEAIEDPRRDRWLLGVQWHPEIDWEGDRLSTEIFSEFIKAAGHFSENRGSTERESVREVEMIPGVR
ncbi:MAG: gamma-glutamyl-gamma-aminobutyrate hydrolase family protein [Pyrinomonadaceae bacterium]|nr:gamma-glutamyl-gamma-aminobutyrate hydrolase family protein [Pyrinomonadaceae bacterium]